MRMRVGHGYDVHALIKGDSLILGGIVIPHDKSLLAHSDGDVVIHAVCDALLGAAALGDIGQHFPDTDPKFKGADSRDLLRTVVQKLHAQGYVIGNIDVTIIAQRPKLAPYLPSMQACLAADLQVPTNDINIKATTTERLGFEGLEEGISTHAVALLVLE